MNIANLRFYSPGGEGGGGQSQADTRQSQADDGKEKTEDAQAVETVDEEQEISIEANRKLRQETAKLRQRTLDAEQAKKDLEERLEALEAAKMTDSERQAEQQKKLEKRAAEAERRAKETERLLNSSRAVAKLELPEVLSDMLHGDTPEEVEEHATLVKAVLEKYYRTKFTQVAPPNPEGGDKSALTAAANGKPSEKDMSQIRRKYKTGV